MPLLRFRLSALGSVIALLVVVTTPATARAGIEILDVVEMTVPDPTFNYVYHAFLTGGNLVATGDYFTIYDMPGIILGTNNQPLNWAVSYSLVGTTPSDVSPADSTTLYNITWTWIGDVSIVGPMDLGSFSNQSRDGSIPSFVYASQTTLPNGMKVGNTGSVNVTPVPEPSAWMLAGLGMPLAGILLGRRRPPFTWGGAALAGVTPGDS